jgi:hypothetical protein
MKSWFSDLGRVRRLCVWCHGSFGQPLGTVDRRCSRVSIPSRYFADEAASFPQSYDGGLISEFFRLQSCSGLRQITHDVSYPRSADPESPGKDAQFNASPDSAGRSLSTTRDFCARLTRRFFECLCLAGSKAARQGFIAAPLFLRVGCPRQNEQRVGAVRRAGCRRLVIACDTLRLRSG